MTQRVNKLTIKPVHPSSMPWSHIMVEGENQPHKIAFWPLYVSCGKSLTSNNNNSLKIVLKYIFCFKLGNDFCAYSIVISKPFLCGKHMGMIIVYKNLKTLFLVRQNNNIFLTCLSSLGKYKFWLYTYLMVNTHILISWRICPTLGTRHVGPCL